MATHPMQIGPDDSPEQVIAKTAVARGWRYLTGSATSDGQCL